MGEPPVSSPTTPGSTPAEDAYAELAGTVLGSQPLGAVLTRIAQLSERVIPAADEVSVTLMDRQRPRTVAFSGNRAAVLDERQYDNGFGPCIDAAVSGNVILVEDVAHDDMYPSFSAQAARAGVRHILSIGLPALTPSSAGALNLYSSGQPFDLQSRELAVGFGAYVAVALTNAAVMTGTLLEVEQLHTAMASRAVIEQAKGIIMGQRQCTPDRAFEILRATSSRGGKKLRDVAQLIVDQTQH